MRGSMTCAVRSAGGADAAGPVSRGRCGQAGESARSATGCRNWPSHPSCVYDTCSTVQSVLIARVSGQSLPDFMAERVFEPLGMA